MILLAVHIVSPYGVNDAFAQNPSPPTNLRIADATSCLVTPALACESNLGDWINCGNVTYCDQTVNCGSCTPGNCGFTGGVNPRPNYCEPHTSANPCRNTIDNACYHRNCGTSSICSTSYDCGRCGPGFVCGRDGVANVCGEPACVPNNTAACAGKVCGRAVNNCGETIHCGLTCGSGKICEEGVCRAPVCPSLASRLTFQKLPIAPSATGIHVKKVDEGFSYWKVTTLKVAVIPQSVPDGLGGGTVIAWNPTQNGVVIPEVRLSRFKPDGTRVLPDFVVSGKRVPGLLAFEDGYAVIAHRPVGCPAGVPPTDCINTTLTRFDLNGAVILSKDIQRVEDGGNGGPWNASGGSFKWLKNNYVSFVGAGTAGHGGTNGILSDINGSRVRWPQWNLGCSHLYGDARVSVNGNRVGAVCSCDALPLGHNYWSTALGTEFPKTDGFGQILFGSRWHLARLGELVPAPGGFSAAYTAFDQSGNGSSNNNNDVAISFLDADDSRYATGGMPRVWITKTPSVDEAAPHIVPFEDGYLAAWRTSPIECTSADISAGKCTTLGTRAKYYVQKLDVNRAPVGIPEELGERSGTPLWFHDHEEFFNYPNGDVGWVWVAQWFNPEAAAVPPITELLQIRLKTCGNFSSGS